MIGRISWVRRRRFTAAPLCRSPARAAARQRQPPLEARWVAARRTGSRPRRHAATRRRSFWPSWAAVTTSSDQFGVPTKRGQVGRCSGARSTSRAQSVGIHDSRQQVEARASAGAGVRRMPRRLRRHRPNRSAERNDTPRGCWSSAGVRAAVTAAAALAGRPGPPVPRGQPSLDPPARAFSSSTNAEPAPSDLAPRGVESAGLVDRIKF